MDCENEVETATGKPMDAPVQGIKSHMLGYLYASIVGFNSPVHDPNNLVRQTFMNYERNNQNKLFFKNGNSRKLSNTIKTELKTKAQVFLK